MKQDRNRLYEGMYILNANLSEDARKKALQKILDGIETRKGEVVKIHEMGRRRLAYTIDKKKEGFYFVVYFNASPEVIQELWEEYQLNEDLVRFITLQADKVLESLEFKPLNAGA